MPRLSTPSYFFRPTLFAAKDGTIAETMRASATSLALRATEDLSSRRNCWLAASPCLVSQWDEGQLVCVVCFCLNGVPELKGYERFSVDLAYPSQPRLFNRLSFCCYRFLSSLVHFSASTETSATLLSPHKIVHVFFRKSMALSTLQTAV